MRIRIYNSSEAVATANEECDMKADSRLPEGKYEDPGSARVWPDLPRSPFVGSSTTETSASGRSKLAESVFGVGRDTAITALADTANGGSVSEAGREGTNQPKLSKGEHT